MNKQEAIYFLMRYSRQHDAAGQLADDEVIFRQYIRHLPEKELHMLMDEYAHLLLQLEWPEEMDNALLARIEHSIKAHSENVGPVNDKHVPERRNSARTAGKSIPLLYKLSAAAAVLILGGVAMTFMLNKQPAAPVETAKHIYDISPGGRKALLVMSNGDTVTLGADRDTVLTETNGIEIKQEKGQLVYNSSNNNTPAYNLLTTPVGGEYELTLADGTHVWLNASSSIRYPASFGGKERIVEITGEAYFEVAKDTESPFKVKINQQMEVEVLGTHFNINAYSDETTIKTTLLEGAVRIKNRGQLQLLKPGQQAQVSRSGALKLVTNVDVRQAVAWKNGLFDFQDVTLQEMMRQLSRWYDIEVVYEGKVSEMTFGGKMVRNLKLPELLKVLEQSKVHFRVEEGRRIIVTQ